eukprot:10584470-Alexandrium_andersonii.AAC.1
MTPGRRGSGHSCSPLPSAGWSRQSPSEPSGPSLSPHCPHGRPHATAAHAGRTSRWPSGTLRAVVTPASFAPTAK